MSAGNWGTVKTLIEGFISSEFNKDTNGVPVNTNPSDQGVSYSIFVDQIRLVATRADLSQANIKVVAPQWFDGTNDVDVTSSACVLLGVVAMTVAAAAAPAELVFYNTTTPTEGTTDFQGAVYLPGDGSAAGARITAVVYPVPVVFSTALSWSVLLNANASFEAGTLAAANSTRVMIVYAQ